MRLKDAASHADVPISTLANILSGRNRPSWELAKQLVAAWPETNVSEWMDGNVRVLQIKTGVKVKRKRG